MKNKTLLLTSALALVFSTSLSYGTKATEEEKDLKFNTTAVAADVTTLEFDKKDRNKDGRVSNFEAADTDGNGKLNFKEALHAAGNAAKKFVEDVGDAVKKKYDHDEDGKIEAHEVTAEFKDDAEEIINVIEKGVYFAEDVVGVVGGVAATASNIANTAKNSKLGGLAPDELRDVADAVDDFASTVTDGVETVEEHTAATTELLDDVREDINSTETATEETK